MLPLTPQAIQSPGRHKHQVGTSTRSAQSAIAPRFTSVGPLPQRIGPGEHAVDATSRLLYYGNRSVATLLEAVMGFPDRIERTVEVAHPPGKVWAALTTAEGLGAWFGDEATIDLRPGGAARMRWSSGFRVEMRVERVEEPTVFGFTWQIYGLPEDDPRRTYVEFTLEPAGAGTRLRVVESGFAQLPEDAYRAAYDGNTKGWASELGELVDYLNAA